MTLSRRVLLAASLSGAVLCACSRPQDKRHPAALTARPPAQPPVGRTSLRPGLRSIPVRGARRDTLVYVPEEHEAAQMRLVLSLHGAGGEAESSVARLQPWADEHGLLILAPASQSTTWDVVRSGWGADVQVIDAALAHVFETFPVDPVDVVVSGFSDGASYALSLGLANGTLLRHVIALSPGFVAQAPRAGEPDIYVTHGTQDEVLPIDRTSRVIVPRLQELGYDVILREFDGVHAAPPAVIEAAVHWLDSVSQRR